MKNKKLMINLDVFKVWKFVKKLVAPTALVASVAAGSGCERREAKAMRLKGYRENSALSLAIPMIIKHEGFRAKPYKDTRHKLTIGYGTNLEDRGISESEARELLETDVFRLIRELHERAWFRILSEKRKSVVVNMAYQLGLAGFNKFKKLISYLAEEDFDSAANEMLKSKWFLQTPKRAKELAEMMRNG